MEIKINPLNNGKFDMVGMTSTEVSTYLKLDQTTHQHVINNAPHFDVGIEVKAGQRLYLDGA